MAQFAARLMRTMRGKGSGCEDCRVEGGVFEMSRQYYPAEPRAVQGWFFDDEAAYHRLLMSTPDGRLARLLDTPHLERVVPHLAPETLHQVIRHLGLDACGELVASMAPAQLATVLDLDLWRSPTPSGDEQFDPERLGEWLETLVELGADQAARIVAGIDRRLMIAGLSRHIRVLDPAAGAGTGDEAMGDVGGYVIAARRTDAWDAIVALLVALDAGDRDCFHAIMRGCRRLSDSGRELDGLDGLLSEPEQLLYDLASERRSRRSEQGYLAAADARAYLEMARRTLQDGDDRSASPNPIAAAHIQMAADDAEPSGSDSAGASAAADAVADALAEAGIAPDRPRALLEGGPSTHRPYARVRALLEHLLETDEAAYLARTRELAFLANALVAGCSVQARPFTAREAFDAAVATCNLGLESDGISARDDLLAAFEAGWAALHGLSLFVAERLAATLADVRCVDRETQEGL